MAVTLTAPSAVTVDQAVVLVIRASTVCLMSLKISAVPTANLPATSPPTAAVPIRPPPLAETSMFPSFPTDIALTDTVDESIFATVFPVNAFLTTAAPAATFPLLPPDRAIAPAPE